MLMKRATFSFVTVPTNGSVAQASTLTFTSPSSGIARLLGRGYCNLHFVNGQNNRLNIGAGPTLASVFSSPVTDWGVLSVPSSSPSGLYQLAWTSESMLSVTANTPTTVFLGVRHEISTTSASDCSGSFEVQVTQALP